MMTREDMLRELELLPIWSLRNSLPSLQSQETPVQQLEPELIQTSVEVVSVSAVLLENDLSESEKLLPEESVATPLVAEPALASSPVFEPQIFRHVASEDGEWLFVLSNTVPTEDEALLLRNIFMAMGIRAKLPAISAITVELLQLTQPKLVIVMSEAVAQQLLQSAESLANLRGTVHALQGIALVVTYELAYLLQVRLDKAKAWADLCLAMQTLQHLKSIT